MLSILLIDDNPNDRLMIERELRKTLPDLEVKSAIDAPSLEQILVVGGFDMVITDYQVRWSDGLTILKQVQSQYPNCPVIMCTDSGSEQVAVEAMKAGLSDYVFKGRHFNRLASAVRESLEKQQLRENYAKTSAQLAISEERLRVAICASQMGTWDWNILTGEVVWSEGHELLFGLEKGSFLGTYEAFFAFIHPDDRDSIARAIAFSLDNKIEYQHEFRVIWPDGSLHWIAARGKFFDDGTGKSVRSIGVVWDITDRKLSEARIQENEENLRFALEAANTVAFSWDVVSAEIRRFSNAQTEIGLHPDSAVGTFEEKKNAVHRDDRDSFLADLDAALSGSGFYDSEHRQERPDGSVIWLHDKGRVVFDASGKPVRLFGVAIDITARKQLEYDRSQALARERSYLHRLQKLTSASVALHSMLSVADIVQLAADSARQILEVHQAAVNLSPSAHWDVGISKFSLSEKYAQWQDYCEEPDGTGIYQEVCRHQQAMRMTQSELEAHQAWRKFGKAADKHPPMRGWLAVPLTARDGRNMGLIQLSDKYEGEFGEDDESILMQLAQAVSASIENARLYEESQQANRMKDEFLATLSHELRSPLNAILGWAQLLRNRSFSPAATARALETIERNAKLQTQLIEDLLDISRIIRGKLTLNPCPVNLISMVEGAVNTVRLAADAKSIDVELAILDLGLDTAEFCPLKEVYGDRESPLNPRFLVSGDPGRLQQIIWNLLTNAIKFTPRGGRVEIRLQRFDSEVELTVTDTGIGIAANFLPYVFESFRQADATITRNYSGLGLGLAIVRQLVELHGGRVWAQSPGLDMGSTFTFRLPSIPVNSIAPEEASVLAGGGNLQGVKVLVVDDEVDSREFMMFVLSDSGAAVRAASCAAEAFEVASEFVPDVLVSDIGMPEEDGYSLLLRLRSLATQSGRKFRAIALTAYARDEDRDRALKASYDRHLTKPVQPDVLVEAVVSLRRAGANNLK
ncbi:MAG: PAS domain-containing protein [Microcoleus sp. PH2017_29_MFU_D_A]|jgi:PAS domain S-box-containing protein|uniref:PAS domain-containing protein n=1 Tax=unclassified Microcoleus TaxID=2642155 RepID=UPI001D71EE64|nr:MULTISPECIES: PAS domain-containing protein [unclassified Microcoleus]MCC3419381.1 PAS domain-containing protein [Microcoleus sp. PH2017_07_MST_O_A]MCC3464501.1 PAS domain-containing protein [Microcoleus sp. PH2017_06_SFM_O_A]TAE39508.1 MAG: response regulator [Oscillatoriales cyanobacterium]MCC3410826.1 PAS domain-containing protein [Microcoleus sp. PH2017_02_FOX_O_A]MCC3425850.1 PAS domain-containing protein [Microcoleus sp. PH2017_01_SCD_O_A]